jgi:large subunit ribosomal protein L10
MALTKNKKKEIVAKLQDIVKNAKTSVFVHFKGLKVSDTTTFRRALRAQGVGFYVAKKTLTNKVYTEAGIKGSMPELVGEVGVAYGADLIAPAREVYEFQKKFKDQLSIQGGVFEGSFNTKEEMLNIALIPPVSTLHGMLANVINSPIQRLAVVLDQVAQKKTA